MTDIEKSVQRFKELIEDTNLKYAKMHETEERISPVSKEMFKEIFKNEHHKKYICKLISAITTFDYEDFYSNIKYCDGEIKNKDYLNLCLKKGDVVVKWHNTYISLGVNSSNHYKNNESRIALLDEVSQLIPGEIIVHININNYQFDDIDCSIGYYCWQDIVNNDNYKPIFTIEIYLPRIRRKKTDELHEMEKTILAMFETSNKKVKELSLGDNILEDYNNTVHEIESDSDFLRRYAQEEIK